MEVSMGILLVSMGIFYNKMKIMSIQRDFMVCPGDILGIER